MHICFPPSEMFDAFVIGYYHKYSPEYVVIHSTVPVGTTKNLSTQIPKIAHSPVEGRHPKLAESIKTFGKLIGVERLEVGEYLAKHFSLAGLKPLVIEGSQNTELGKIMSTTRLGWDVVFMKEVARLCKEAKADFEMVYTLYTKNYNQGYADMDQVAFSKFHRPVLKNMPGKIKGHCVIPNLRLIKSDIADYIKEKNDSYEEET